MQNTVKLINLKTSVNLPEKRTLTVLAVDGKRTQPVLVLPFGLHLIVCSVTSCHNT